MKMKLGSIIAVIILFIAAGAVAGSSMTTSSASTATIAAEKHTYKAEAASPIGGTSKIADGLASGGYLVGLTTPGQGVRFAGLPTASKLALRYAAVEAGTSPSRKRRSLKNKLLLPKFNPL